MKVDIASDHAGYELKEKIKIYLKEKLGFEVSDYGTNSHESVDYPDFAQCVASNISDGRADQAILICGSGIGMAMAANRYPHVRAAVLREPCDAEMSRSHNDANVACFGGRITPFEKAKKLLDIWFKTPFEGGRHSRRVGKIDSNKTGSNC